MVFIIIHAVCNSGPFFGTISEYLLHAFTKASAT